MKLGTTIGQYRILRKIGSGGMGAVYLGEHALLGRPAAIKTLLPALSSVHEIVDRFFNEARATSAISDAGVVQIFDFGYHTDGTAYIVMEYLEGEQLDARIERLVKLPMIDALRIARQLACSLEAAHARGIVHRDLKPENVFLVRDHEAQGGERPKLLDFGIAKIDADLASHMRTQTGAMLGTPTYMSPEQCRGAGEVDDRSDQYALGCVLFHMLTGAPPFDGEGVGDIIAAHLREPAPSPSSLALDLPAAVDQLVLRCLAKSPDDRYPSMAELQVAIEAVLARISASRLMLATPRDGLATATTLDAPLPLPLPPRRKRPTTIGTASGENLTLDDLRPRPLGLWAACSIFVLGGVAAFAIATHLARSEGTPSAAAAGHDAGVKVDAPPPPPPVDAGPPPIDARAPLPVDAGAPPIDAAMPPIDAGPVPSKPRRERQVAPAPERQVIRKSPPPRAEPARRTRPEIVEKKPVQDLYDIR